MSGLRDGPSRDAYLALLDGYLRDLAAAGVTTIDTRPVPVQVGGRPPVVYLLQPLVPGPGLGSSLVREADDATLADAVATVLDLVLRLHRADRDRAPGDQVAVDAQMSNWWFDPGGTGPPLLLDVGTPFVRSAGAHALDTEIFLSAVPPGLRAYYRRKGDVESYLDDYFVPRTVALDLLGNFHKEGRPDRVPATVALVNEWLAANAAEVGDARPITTAEVADYYRDDAAQLALFLRVRRMDRFLRTRLLRRRYDFVLPGRIER
jgi:hypothetical protein